jgi:hypothetical protein
MVRTPAARPFDVARRRLCASALPSGEIRKINENCYATIGQSATPNTKTWSRQSWPLVIAAFADQPRRFAQSG